jgi:hypothetical protein
MEEYQDCAHHFLVDTFLLLYQPGLCLRICSILEDNQRVTYTYTVSADVIGLLSV